MFEKLKNREDGLQRKEELQNKTKYRSMEEDKRKSYRTRPSIEVWKKTIGRAIEQDHV